MYYDKKSVYTDFPAGLFARNGAPGLAKKLWLLSLLALLVITLSGCGAAHTMVKKRNLDVQTKMSDTIFLEPRKPSEHIVYVSIKNTSDKDLVVKDRIIETLKANGYRITRDPDEAMYMLQSSILQCGKTDLRTATNALTAGFGGAAGGVAIAAVAGSGGKGMAGAGLLGAALGVVGDALVDDTLFSMITDLQIRERPMRGEKVTQSMETNAAQGSSTALRQSVTGGEVKWKTYRTRIMSTANKANLKFAEAQPVLEDGLVRSISGIFSD